MSKLPLTSFGRPAISSSALSGRSCWQRYTYEMNSFSTSLTAGSAFLGLAVEVVATMSNFLPRAGMKYDIYLSSYHDCTKGLRRITRGYVTMHVITTFNYFKLTSCMVRLIEGPALVGGTR